MAERVGSYAADGNLKPIQVAPRDAGGLDRQETVR